MQYPIHIPNTEPSQIAVETAGFLSGPKLLVNGEIAPKGPKRGEFLLQRDDGTSVTVQLKTFLLDPVPQVIIDNQTINIVEPLRWYQWVWAGLPILMVFGGGCIGAFFGIMATNINTRIFRSTTITGVVQYMAVAGVSFLAVVIYLIIAIAVANLR